MVNLLCALLASTPLTSLVPVEAKPQVTFAFFGCNRIDAKDFKKTKKENPSSANIPQLRQNLADIAVLAPDYAFFGGDLVVGYGDDDGKTLRKQMGAWIDLIKTMPKAPNTHYVAISGNHEKNRKVDEEKLPNPATDAVWTQLVTNAGLIPTDAKGPRPASSKNDLLMGDQSALSFSFTRGSIHFVILDTDTRVKIKDPKTGETKIGMVPIHWLDADLTLAEKDPKVKSVVVMGHRNLIDPATAKGDAPIDPASGGPMMKSLLNHAKVRAYICAHVHAFDITPIGSKVYQTTFGNGGSKLEKGWKPKGGRMFGFGYFESFADGSLRVTPYLRPEPKSYQSTKPYDVPAAFPQPTLMIRP